MVTSVERKNDGCVKGLFCKSIFQDCEAGRCVCVFEEKMERETEKERM